MVICLLLRMEVVFFWAERNTWRRGLLGFWMRGAGVGLGSERDCVGSLTIGVVLVLEMEAVEGAGGLTIVSEGPAWGFEERVPRES